ncbi:hypothetical protein ACFO5K_09235 [Nocardia halotolerans]|uniref:Uncharacterized protein n=1 Tax=Nocardia halotolerans TaxID=1755878 RepID=A0ABV8VHX3_9NOCA
MNRTVADSVSVGLQAVAGLIIGAVSWTSFQVSVPEIGHWLVNALALAPILASAAAVLIHTKARRFAVLGWSIASGAIVYGYLFTLLVLIHL